MAEALAAGRFITFIEKKLIPEADPQEWLVRAQPALERFPETSRLKPGNGITEGADAGEQDCVDTVEVAAIVNKFYQSSLALERLLHTPKVSASVVNKPDDWSHAVLLPCVRPKRKCRR